MYSKVNVGIIHDLKTEQFLFGGKAYLKSEKHFKNGKFVEETDFVDFIAGINNGNERINLNLAFAKKIDEIKNKRNELEKNKTKRYEDISMAPASSSRAGCRGRWRK